MTNTQQETLAGLNIASHFFYQTFHQAPSREFLEALRNEQLMEHWPVEPQTTVAQQGLGLIQQSLVDPVESVLEGINNDYCDLFVGPGTLKAAPWASVYLTEEQMICGDPTIAIKAFYREFGVEIDTGEREPEDHIGLVFAFLAHLTDQALEHTENQEAIQPWLCATQSFLTDHILTWAPRFLSIMRENSDNAFYQGVSLLAEDTLQQLAELTNADYKIVRLYR